MQLFSIYPALVQKKYEKSSWNRDFLNIILKYSVEKQKDPIIVIELTVKLDDQKYGFEAHNETPEQYVR